MPRCCILWSYFYLSLFTKCGMTHCIDKGRVPSRTCQTNMISEIMFRLCEQKPVIAWRALASAGRHEQPVVHTESSAVAVAGWYFCTAGFGVFAKSKVQQALPRKGFLGKYGMKENIKVWVGFGREEAWSLFWAEKYFLIICTYEKNVFHMTRCCLRSVAQSKASFPLAR